MDDPFELAVKEYGFESVQEFHRLVATRDLSTPELRARFRAWQFTDGRKEALLTLPARPDKA